MSHHKGAASRKLRGHKPGCHCVGCDPNTRKRGMAALKRHPRRKKNPKKLYDVYQTKALAKKGVKRAKRYGGKKVIIRKSKRRELPYAVYHNSRKKRRKNPAFKWTTAKREHEVTIYAKFLPFKIYAVKGSSSMYAGERFQHQFKAGGRVTGLADGSIRLYPAKGKRLWGMIKQR